MKPKSKECENPECDNIFTETNGKKFCSQQCKNYFHYYVKDNKSSTKINSLFELKLLWGAIYLTVKRKNS